MPDKNKNNLLKSLEEITENYVFTPDNFIKMIFILMRIKADIPVIMMGETGCGKTSLIRKLSELMNNGETYNMKILNIHPEITAQNITEFIKNEVNEASIILSKNESIKFMNNNNYIGQIYFEKKIWIFLDELNTCKSMGLISELFCKKSFNGEKLPSNVILIGACNPYRYGIRMEEIGLDVDLAYKEKEDNLNDKQKEIIRHNSLDSKNKLVYNVNPLPFSLLYYVFNFGNLGKEDEVKYIEKMIQYNFDKIIEKNMKKKELSKLIKELPKLKELAKKLIEKSHCFIREKYDKSSISLREIQRFNLFFKFFYENLSDNFELEKEIQFSNSFKPYNIIISSIYLSIYICYYLRLTDKELRKQLYDILNKKLYNKNNNLLENDFLFICKAEQDFLIENINIEKGISKNNALIDNLFSLFVAINNKVPIFIVGKPGSSKSLSVQLITKAMKGSYSSNLFFKKLPKIIMNSYQGSMGSTSESVENIFTRAKNVLNNFEKEKKNIISMVFFDEMGLAEYSPNNPLKVIHYQLDYDLIKEKNPVAFVGISNWKLDSAKMNRGIFISIPDPDKEDVKDTAFTIGKSFDFFLAEKNKDFFYNLGEIYFNYKEYLKKEYHLDRKEDFHGNRDFYHLIKNCSQNLLIKYNKNKDINENDLIEIGLNSIERNFGGITFNDITSVEKVKYFFKEKYPSFEINKEYDVIGRITDNISDINSRYLLLEYESSSSLYYLLKSIISKLNKDYYFYFGSKIKKDQSEEYIFKVLNKVQIFMEQKIILIMENLDLVYPSMYDLFNQNFAIIGDKRYARLATDSNTNNYSLINQDFRCIINVNIKEVNKLEAPFLNRFEKQIISFEYFLSKELIKESNRIYNIINDMCYVDKNSIYKGINYDLKKLLINCDLEEIRAIIYDSDKKGIAKEELLDLILSKISLTLPQDIILYLKYNKKYPDEYKKIIDYYQKGEHINLYRFIQTMKDQKNVIYTFSNIFDIMQIKNDINNKTFGNINKENTIILKINNIESENEFEEILNNFMNNNKQKLCIIQFNTDEGSMMNYIQYFIENKEKEHLKNNKDKKIKENKKVFIFIIHIRRIFNHELENFELKDEKTKKEINKKILKETISNLSGYYQIFIDNLNGDEKLTVDIILKMKGNGLFSKFLDLDEELSKNIFKSILYIKYNINSYIGNLNKDNYIKTLLDYIKNNKKIRDLINECILRQITYEDDIMNEIFKKKNTINESDIDIVSIIKRYLLNLYIHKLNLLVFKAEKDHFFSSLLSFNESNYIEDLNIINKYYGNSLNM